jgi:putative PEP-CTERM system integral membrane protein
MFSNINAINTAAKRLQHAARAQGVPITFFSACDTILTLEQPTGALSDQIFFFGQTTLTKICSLYSKHIDSTKYSSLIILSDDGGYEMTSDSEMIPSFSSPVFIVNISTSAASAYPDDLVEMVQKSGGAFAESTDELFARLRTVKYAALHPEFVTFAGDYVVNKTENVSLKEIPDAAQLSAKYYIGYYSRNAAMEQIFNLDFVHTIAKRYPVVTPYSSMIVLVDINQEKLLADAEKRDDRFDREIESGKEELSSPFDALKVNATPEPHEWMIIISIAVLALIAIYIRNKKNIVQG